MTHNQNQLPIIQTGVNFKIILSVIDILYLKVLQFHLESNNIKNWNFSLKNDVIGYLANGMVMPHKLINHLVESIYMGIYLSKNKKKLLIYA